MTPDILRLHYAPDNASLVIRLAMEEIGVPYETVLVDRRSGQQKSTGYLKLNPNGLIPVLETPHGPMSETAAILLWLSDTYGGPDPFPDHPDRAPYLSWLFFASNTLHADLRMTFYPGQYATDSDDVHLILRQGLRARIDGHLDRLDNLVSNKPNWLDGAHPSGLSWYIACMIRWMALYPAEGDRSWFSLAQRPHLTRMLSVLEDRPAARRAIKAEGLGPTPFTAPHHPNPPEGSAT